MNAKNGLFLAVVVALVGAMAFFVGVRFQRRFVSGNMNWFYPYQQFYPGFKGGMHRGMMGDGYGFRQSGLIQGQITKIDGNNITIQRLNGTTYTITVSDQTPFSKTVSGSKTDLVTGKNITVYGGASQTGGYTVQSILINP